MFDDKETEFSDLDDDCVINAVVLELTNSVSCKSGELFTLLFAIFLCCSEAFFKFLDLFFDFLLYDWVALEIFVSLFELREFFINSIESI